MSFWRGLNKHRIRYITAGAGFILTYLVAVLVFDSIHSARATVRAFVNAVHDGSPAAVSAMIDQADEAIPSWQMKGFVAYYHTHGGALDKLLSPISAGGSRITQGDGASVNEAHLKPHWVLGFRTYQIVVPRVPYDFNGPANVTFFIDGAKVHSSGDLLPAEYDTEAAIQTPVGRVTEDASADAASGNDVLETFRFPDYMLTITSALYSGTGTVIIDQKPAGVVDLYPSNNNQTTIGPYPLQGVHRVSVEFKEPWGTFVESGSVRNGQVTLLPDAAANVALTKQMAKVMFTFYKDDCAALTVGSYQPVIKHMATYMDTQGPAYQRFSSDMSTGGPMGFRVRVVNISPSLMPWTSPDGQPGFYVQTTIYLHANGVDFSSNFLFIMEYDQSTGKWIIYDWDQSPSSVNAKAPNFSLKE